MSEETVKKSPRSRLLMRGAGVMLIVIAVLAWFLLVGYVGLQSGQSQLVENQKTEAANQIVRQLELARADVEGGRYTLAARRLNWILERSPAHSEAQALLQQAQNPLNAIAPTAAATPASAQPTATPMPSPTPGDIADPAAELTRIKAVIAAENWNDAIVALDAFQRQFPGYERPETDKALYDSLVALGLSLLEGEDVEQGLFYLERAEILGNLPQEAEDYRLWAELYLQGIGFYGVNWDVAAYYFRDLCLAAPFYQSSCDLLLESLVGLGDLYSNNQDYCPAAPLYQEALSYANSQNLRDKLAVAQEGCAQATPTPGVITGTTSITN